MQRAHAQPGKQHRRDAQAATSHADAAQREAQRGYDEEEEEGISDKELDHGVCLTWYSLRSMMSSMKVKTSITLSEDVLESVDRLSGDTSRSEFIEAALRQVIAELIRKAQNERDIDIINRHADRLNAEAFDVLSYQVAL